MPNACPFGDDGAACRVGKHSIRERHCGPGYGLVVAVCRTHGRYFTLYPPGWVPYGRVPLTREHGRGWLGTLFAAAILASQGDVWPDASVGAPGCGTTQRRRIARAGAWLGLSHPLSELERAALGLHVPLEAAVAQRRKFGTSRRRRERGRAIAQMLSAMAEDGPLLWRLLAVGVELGECGPAYRCDDVGVLHRVFPTQNRLT